jgi:hypothetical protein
MTDAATLRALIERVEQATGADRRLDGDIETALGWPFAPWTGDARPFTSSLDAAASLVPDGWSWSVDTHNKAGPIAICEPARGVFCRSEASTPALALTAAALRARLAEMEAGDE